MPVDIDRGLTPAQAKDLATKLGFSKKSVDPAAAMFQQLYKLFIEKDATMVEINPMAESANGEGIMLCDLLMRARMLLYFMYPPNAAQPILFSPLHGCQTQL